MTEASARFDRICATLRDRICLLDAPPGTRLSEEALAKEFGTSRTPIRRVLARLEAEGLVAVRSGVGSIVTDLDPTEFAQVYALRLELTQLVAVLDPVKPTQAHVDRVQGFVTRGEALAAAPDARGFATLNRAFHDFGLSLTANTALREVAERLYLRTARIWLQAVAHMDLAQECAIFAEEIRQTHEALRAGDVQAAALIRRAHISMSAARLARI
ncbi:GntR family transcriptional regulator [Citreimonas salinaria]|uniref:Transcriptional regulator, GntR family n=1 Tax=Citreimonas salinaria TaxID=321339 RepID=A0A1H3JHW7_9RHOB|nr:GntR family transcriptional regulator [Citreimonas salinaria]SDY39008.1 transcriptional regulator, GntR family [Citreimonas salinaria]